VPTQAAPNRGDEMSGSPPENMRNPTPPERKPPK